ncbi:flagellar basal body P-ring formation protein FlgA [Paraburkholderia sp. T12-10]|nr:flagellar basal body P-ring formation protein FlgA [Paraburkholderia sp. T12-10]
MSVSAASDPARRSGRRALGRRSMRLAGLSRLIATAGGVLAAALLLPAGAAHAQTAGTNGRIYIPGPGEARAAQQSGTVSIPGTGEPQASQQSAMISIPGPGERRATDSTPSGAAANGMIVIPGPGEARANAPAAALANTVAVQRPMASGTTSVGATAGRSIPVIVTAPQRAARAVQPVAVEQPANMAFAPAAAVAQTGTAVQAPVSPAAPARVAPRVVAQAAAATPAPAAPATSAASAMTPAPTAAATPTTNAPAGQEDGETIRRAALAFLQQQTVGLPGKIGIKVMRTFPRGLGACTTLEPFMPTGARLWGRTTVGVRCAGAKPWTLYLQAQISIEATYYLAAHQIESGAMVTAEDLLARDGDLSNLPRAIITDPSQAVGSTALVRINAGMPLRQDLLKSASAVTIGQTVRVVAQGQGFSISSEGSVMNNASPGQQVRVRMAGGQIISGIVKDGSTVQVEM